MPTHKSSKPLDRSKLELLNTILTIDSGFLTSQHLGDRGAKIVFNNKGFLANSAKLLNQLSVEKSTTLLVTLLNSDSIEEFKRSTKTNGTESENLKSLFLCMHTETPMAGDLHQATNTQQVYANVVKLLLCDRVYQQLGEHPALSREVDDILHHQDLTPNERLAAITRCLQIRSHIDPASTAALRPLLEQLDRALPRQTQQQGYAKFLHNTGRQRKRTPIRRTSPHLFAPPPAKVDDGQKETKDDSDQATTSPGTH